MTHYERLKNLSIEEMAAEIKAIANWDRKEKTKAEQNPDWYIKYLNTPVPDDKCKVIGTDYCKNECPLCRLGTEPNEN